MGYLQKPAHEGISIYKRLATNLLSQNLTEVTLDFTARSVCGGKCLHVCVVQRAYAMALGSAARLSKQSWL